MERIWKAEQRNAINRLAATTCLRATKFLSEQSKGRKRRLSRANIHTRRRCVKMETSDWKEVRRTESSPLGHLTSAHVPESHSDQPVPNIASPCAKSNNFFLLPHEASSAQKLSCCQQPAPRTTKTVPKPDQKHMT